MQEETHWPGLVLDGVKGKAISCTAFLVLMPKILWKSHYSVDFFSLFHYSVMQNHSCNISYCDRFKLEDKLFTKTHSMPQAVFCKHGILIFFDALPLIL